MAQYGVPRGCFSTGVGYITLRTVDLTAVSFPFLSRANRRAPKAFAEHAESSSKPHGDEWKAIVESERKAKGMSKEEAWTLYHMAYDLEGRV